MNGHKLRILSSENDASVKVQQDQNTNITSVKVQQDQNTNITLKLEHTPSQADLKESAPQINTSPPYAPPGFTPGAQIPTPLAPEQFSAGAYPSVSAVPTVNPMSTALPPLIMATFRLKFKLETLISRLTLRTKTDRLKYLSLSFHVMRTIRSSSTNSLSASTKHL